MHFEPGGARLFSVGAVFGADAQSARGGLHRPEQQGLESPENHGPGWFSGRAEGVVQGSSALIDDESLVRAREATTARQQRAGKQQAAASKQASSKQQASRRS
jgi:hypothetical protein